MQQTTVSILLDLNRQFYQTFGAAFAETRRRIQPGVRRVLESHPPGQQWLDLGCGSGSVGRAWAQRARAAGQNGLYWGLDFSAALLEEARRAVEGLDQPGLTLRFTPADLGSPDWTDTLGDQRFDIAAAFAVLHHIPSAAMRLALIRQVRRLLNTGGVFILSVWQFQHSQKWLDRRLPWAGVGLSEADLEPGDTLLDWRFALPGQTEQVGRRYVHLFTSAELADLAAQAGFEVVDEFASDGQGGKLGLYQTWK